MTVNDLLPDRLLSVRVSADYHTQACECSDQLAPRSLWVCKHAQCRRVQAFLHKKQHSLVLYFSVQRLHKIKFTDRYRRRQTTTPFVRPATRQECASFRKSPDPLVSSRAPELARGARCCRHDLSEMNKTIRKMYQHFVIRS